MSANSQLIQTEGGSISQLEKGSNPMIRAAAVLFIASAAFWGFLLLRWMTFSVFEWEPLPAELALATLPPLAAYLIYGLLLATDLLIGLGLLRDREWARWLGVGWAVLIFIVGLFYYYVSRDFYFTVFLL